MSNNTAFLEIVSETMKAKLQTLNIRFAAKRSATGSESHMPSIAAIATNMRLKYIKNPFPYEKDASVAPVMGGDSRFHIGRTISRGSYVSERNTTSSIEVRFH